MRVTLATRNLGRAKLTDENLVLFIRLVSQAVPEGIVWTIDKGRKGETEAPAELWPVLVRCYEEWVRKCFTADWLENK